MPTQTPIPPTDTPSYIDWYWSIITATPFFGNDQAAGSIWSGNSVCPFNFIKPRGWEFKILAEAIEKGRCTILFRPGNWLKEIEKSTVWHPDYPGMMEFWERDFLSSASINGFVFKEGRWIVFGRQSSEYEGTLIQQGDLWILSGVSGVGMSSKEDGAYAGLGDYHQIIISDGFNQVVEIDYDGFHQGDGLDQILRTLTFLNPPPPEALTPSPTLNSPTPSLTPSKTATKTPIPYEDSIVTATPLQEDDSGTNTAQLDDPACQFQFRYPDSWKFESGKSEGLCWLTFQPEGWLEMVEEAQERLSEYPLSIDHKSKSFDDAAQRYGFRLIDGDWYIIDLIEFGLKYEAELVQSGELLILRGVTRTEKYSKKNYLTIGFGYVYRVVIIDEVKNAVIIESNLFDPGEM